MQRNFKLGELVWVYKDGGFCGYGLIEKMIDMQNGEYYQQKDVITGVGKKNTQVKILVNIMWLGGSSIDDQMEELSEPISQFFDPHDIIKIDFTEMEREYEDKLKLMNKKLEMVKKYSLSREDKINLIFKN